MWNCNHHGSSLICTLDQILASPVAMARPLSIKVTMFYYWAFVLLLTITSSLNVYSTLQDVLGEQLGNDLQNCCSQVSSSVPDCTRVGWQPLLGSKFQDPNQHTTVPKLVHNFWHCVSMDPPDIRSVVSTVLHGCEHKITMDKILCCKK